MMLFLSQNQFQGARLFCTVSNSISNKLGLQEAKTIQILGQLSNSYPDIEVKHV